MLSELSPLTCFTCGVVDNLVMEPCDCYLMEKEHPCDCLCEECVIDECEEDWCNDHQQTESECSVCNPLERDIAEDLHIENLIDELRFEA